MNIDVQKTRKNIRDRCKEKGINRQQVAEYCGVSMSAVDDWMYSTGKKMPSLDSAISLAGLLGCTVEELFVGKESH